MSASSSSSQDRQPSIRSEGKENTRFRLYHIYEKTVKIDNIPLDLSIEEIQQAFHNDLYEEFHLPRDIFDKHIGVAFLKFKCTRSRDQFLSNLNYLDKFVYLTQDIYQGPLKIKAMEMSDYDESLNGRVSLRFTSSTSADEVAVKIGQLYVNVEAQTEKKIKEGLEEIKQFEKTKEHQELLELKNSHYEKQKAIAEKQKDIDAEKKDAERLHRQFIERQEAYEKKYGKSN